MQRNTILALLAIQLTCDQSVHSLCGSPGATRALPRPVMRAWKRITVAKTWTRYRVFTCCKVRPVWGRTIDDGSFDARGTFGAGYSRVCDLFLPIQDMRDRRSGFGEVAMGVVRSAASFSTRWLVRQLPCVCNSLPASLFQVSDTQDRFNLQSQPALGPYSLVSNWNHCSQQRHQLF